MENKMQIKFLSLSKNENFARAVVSAFILPLNPNISELSDVKTAVSEAVTNCVVHGYNSNQNGYITISMIIKGNKVIIKVSDKGVGIENLTQALQPFFTTKPEEERSGMGFTIIQTFMENVKVKSVKGKGTTVIMTKTIGKKMTE